MVWYSEQAGTQMQQIQQFASVGLARQDAAHPMLQPAWRRDRVHRFDARGSRLPSPMVTTRSEKSIAEGSAVA
jgi:hypothetical protein